MIKPNAAMERDVRTYCAKIGRDPLLVQGAGGNASWKEGDTLWIKASGTWLSNADNEQIFVPVNLVDLRTAMSQNNFSEAPKVIGNATLRPSIETMLHALMPQRVVVHLHAVEALARLVRANPFDDLQGLLKGVADFAAIGYLKPGESLARATAQVLREQVGAQIIFLANHGVVLGGDSITEIEALLSQITTRLACTRIMEDSEFLPLSAAHSVPPYAPITDLGIQQLALDARLFDRLPCDWALYPDHVVFLGPVAHTYTSVDAFHDADPGGDSSPELVFIRGAGVFAKPSFTAAKQAQLRCYFDVLVRQQPASKLKVLSGGQIAELLNWDAEKYRMALAKSTTNVSPGSA